jgi:hypothetical protein
MGVRKIGVVGAGAMGTWHLPARRGPLGMLDPLLYSPAAGGA